MQQGNSRRVFLVFDCAASGSSCRRLILRASLMRAKCPLKRGQSADLTQLGARKSAFDFMALALIYLSSCYGNIFHLIPSPKSLDKAAQVPLRNLLGSCSKSPFIWCSHFAPIALDSFEPLKDAESFI